MPQFTVTRLYDLSFEDFARIRAQAPFASLGDLAKEIRRISSIDSTLRWPLKDTIQIAEQLKNDGVIIVEQFNEPDLLKRIYHPTMRAMADDLVSLRKEAGVTLAQEQAMILVESYIAQNRLQNPEASQQ
tara:strand:- start:1625 stop:2014 length:390 start_codon:yes stop_codon:yes gene_type:complete